MSVKICKQFEKSIVLTRQGDARLAYVVMSVYRPLHKHVTYCDPRWRNGWNMMLKFPVPAGREPDIEPGFFVF